VFRWLVLPEQLALLGRLVLRVLKVLLALLALLALKDHLEPREQPVLPVLPGQLALRVLPEQMEKLYSMEQPLLLLELG
jgi:hypothetical protein